MIDYNINPDNSYKVFDLYPTNTGLYTKEKNIIFLASLVPVFLISYGQFFNPSISEFSNRIRALLGVILVLMALYNINRKPKLKNLKIHNDSLMIDEQKIEFTEIQGFEMVDLGEYLEVVILTTRFIGRFEYFYIETNQNQENVKAIVNLLLAETKYIQDLSDKDITQRIARTLFIK